MGYDPGERETHWQDRWQEWGVFHWDPDSTRPLFIIDNPPRYASGALHLGHATSYTQIDFAARYRRLRGDSVLFPLCADVNGMPIEVAVEKKHGVSKRDTPRQKLIELCTAFADANIERMVAQFKLLGHSMDPTQWYRTDSEEYRSVTQRSFLRMYEKGLVYKKDFPVTWCCHCGTALAAADVEYEERSTTLCTVAFSRADGSVLEIATTRPELICACQAVVVHPDDDRYRALVGTKVTTPLYGKEVPMVADADVDPAFGSGAVMVCSIGDRVDLTWLLRHKLPIEGPIDRDGAMTALVGAAHAGTPIEAARAGVREDLRAADKLLAERPTTGNVGCCWRCRNPVEFLQVPQWFFHSLRLRERVKEVAKEVRWYPEAMRTRLDNWVDSLAWDWCVSRQRYFATAIPLWECVSCGKVVVADDEQLYVDPTVDPPPVPACPRCKGELKGCEDVFDTWVDSSFTAPFIARWGRDEELFKDLYPVTLRPQSHDIIRTWAFYSLLRSVQLFDQRPWEEIMISGFIMAPDGSPMHTSRGNIVDPLPLIAQYGADAFRIWAANCSLGVDHAFQEKVVVHGSRLVQKVYNALSFAGTALDGYRGTAPRAAQLPVLDRWVLHLFKVAVDQARLEMEEYRFDQALRLLEQFLWHEFADHYLEAVKPRIAVMATGTPDLALQSTLHAISEGMLAALSMFLPHVCEEVYQTKFRRLSTVKSVGQLPWPMPALVDEEARAQGERIKEVLAVLRHWRTQQTLRRSDALPEVELVSRSPLADLAVIREAANIRSLRTASALALEEVTVAVRPNHKTLGPHFRGQAKAVVTALQGLSGQGLLDAAAALSAAGGLSVTLADGSSVKVDRSMVELQTQTRAQGHAVEVLHAGDVTIVIHRGA